MTTRKKLHPLIKDVTTLAHDRPLWLQEAKRHGKRIVQYSGNFIPEALLYAAGATPYLMRRWEQAGVSEARLAALRRLRLHQEALDDGYAEIGLDPVSPLADLIVMQQTDCHVGRVTELMEYLTLPIYKVGVPADWKTPFAPTYYYNALARLKTRLEELGGHAIGPGELQGWMELVNKLNRGLQRIDSFRKRENPPISGYEFIQLNHATLYVEPDRAIDTLHSLSDDLEDAQGTFDVNTPRLLLAGHVLEFGEDLVPAALEHSGAVIVAEMLDEGVRHFRWCDDTEGDLLKNLGETRYLKKVPTAMFQPAWRERFAYMQGLLREYRIDGLVWLEQDHDEIYEMESLCIAKWLTGLQIPMLKLEICSTMSPDAVKILKTRMKTFVEYLRAEKIAG